MLRSEEGATAIEYSLIASMLALALVPVLADTSSGMAGLYTTISDLFAQV
jgi:Flp pilus assembly pilin Flp